MPAQNIQSQAPEPTAGAHGARTASISTASTFKQRTGNGSSKPSAPQPGASSRQVPQAVPQIGEPFYGLMWPTWYQPNRCSTASGLNSSAPSRQAPRAPPQTGEPFFGLMWPQPYWYQPNGSLSTGSSKPSAPQPGVASCQAPQAPPDPTEDDFEMKELDWYHPYNPLEEPMELPSGMNGPDWYLPSEPLPPVDPKPKPWVSRGIKSSSHTRPANSQGAPSTSRPIPPATNKRVAPSRSAAPTATSNKSFSQSTTQKNSERASVSQRSGPKATNRKAPASISKSNVHVKARNTTAPSSKSTASQQKYEVPQGVPSNAVSASPAGTSTGLPTQSRDLSHWH